MTLPNEADARFMDLALRLAERGLGQTWPNPAVGCVIVRDGMIVGRGWTRPAGGAHAEVEALRRAGSRALGASAYVTLEPCAHYGRTPPCTMALIHAGVRRVVAATLCPDQRVDGRGVEQLRQAGIEVEIGLCQDQAEALNAGFFLHVKANRPLVTLKLATSLDGRIATRTGASQWITGEDARTRAHRLRATHDAIMIGSGTALADDPSLTCRLPGLADRSPVRIVLDGRLRLSPQSQLASSAQKIPTWLFTRRNAASDPAAALHASGVDLIETDADSSGQLDLAEVLAVLAARGITRLLVEGGATLAAALLRQRVVDRLVWFHAPLVIGGDAIAAVGPLGVEALTEAVAGVPITRDLLARDSVQTYIIKDR